MLGRILITILLAVWTVPVWSDEPIAITTAKSVETKVHGRKFSVLKRSDQLQRPDCQSCHDGSGSKSKPHAEIELVHAKKQGMSCVTCHNKPNVWQLKNPNNAVAVSIDHAYASCQGCHAPQAKDWANGAHGKRLATWRGKRIIYNCTQCHNPHDPRHEKRWPKTQSSLPEH